MAVPPSAAAAAPVLDDTVELTARWRLLPKAVLVVLVAGTVTLGLTGAAAYALWPEPPHPVKKRMRRATPPVAAASSAASAAALAQAASMPMPISVPPPPTPASVPMAGAAASAPRPAANAPEDSLDKLQRRLAETLGEGGRLQPTGPGELRLTARRPPPPARRSARAATPAASAASTGCT